MKLHVKWPRRLVAAAAAITLALGIAPASAWASSFSDVPDNAWYTSTVEWANGMGVLVGHDGQFDPEDPLTRGQAAVVLYRYLGDGEQAPACSKTDVNQNAYYATAVNWAVEHHVINGYGGTTKFGPNDPLTREQAAAILANATNADTQNASDAAYNKLANTQQTDSWAKPSVVWAVDKGIIHGVRGVDLAPRATLTRAQMAAMLQNADSNGVFVVPTTTVTTEFLGTDAYGQYEVWAKAANQQIKRVDLTADIVAQNVLDSTPDLTASTSYTQYGWYLAGITKNGRTLAWNEETGQYWSFYVNGEYSMLGASSVHVHDGDVLFFPYKSDDQPLPALQ